MDRAVRQAISELNSANWFRDVGNPGPSGVRLVGSWSEASRLCRSSEWEQVQLEAGNLLTEKLRSASPEGFRAWNEKVRELKPVAEDLVNRKLRESEVPGPIADSIRDAVNWDILSLLLEAEHKSDVSPGFFTSLGFWYANGRFPCGWDGAFPDGRLCVF